MITNHILKKNEQNKQLNLMKLPKYADIANALLEDTGISQKIKNSHIVINKCKMNRQKKSLGEK